MAYLAVEGDRRIYYERYAGSGRPVILVHGWGMSVRVWDTTVPALLAAGHEVVGLDHRGCGSSDKDFEDVSIGTIGSDVVRLVEELGLDAVILNGWSLGGAVVVDAGVKLGGRLAGLVLTAGATPKYLQGDGWPHGGTRDVFDQTIAALRDNRPEFLHALSEGVCHAEVGRATVEWMWQIFMQTGPRADAALADLGEIDQRKILGEISVPVLVAHGTNDAIVPFDIGAEAAKLLSGARLVEFDHSGHAPFMEEGPKYRSELVEFCASVG